MHSLIFASNNEHKVYEIRSVIGDQFNILSLKEAAIDIDIPEPYYTLEENAKEKCYVINRLTQKDCFSEDTGLEVEVLNGEPGVFSARYAGDAKNDVANIKKLLYNMEGKTNRKAQFRTIIFLMLNKTEYVFEGICKGTISAELKGSSGFGYDPVFIPEGATKTFGEMDIREKNLYSHRQKATAQLLTFLSHFGKKMSS